MHTRSARLHRPRCSAGRIVFLIALAHCWAGSAADNDNPFADFVRKTDPRPPVEEQKSFHLPPGFEIQLVAAEPDIGKPMNLAFDERGRLWMTQSREYPFAAPTNAPGRDQIKILSDFDPAGRARRVTTFADGLNIPIGIYPYRGGAIAFSIPCIYRFEDTDGDGRADQREVLYGTQGFDLDVHGLTGAFRRGFDGWLYADHGFRNNSTLKGKDGHTITMTSGNTYRMKPDGSRVEQFTWGQVNPFGLMFDPLGDLWSADCHSSPVYLLLRGAYYPSFGKPHDGLGFGPNICAHSHGSTAIAGIVYYAATNFPPGFRSNTFVGNVMTCRINRDSFTEHGSTRLAKAEPDFLRSDDPWFRPVDLQLGPDGALYVADFYNRIIGHYEVPLDHPGRDRERGRIWRIVYTGGTSDPSPTNQSGTRATRPSVKPNLALPTDVKGLIAELGNPNITRRMLAMNELVDRIGQPAVRPLEKVLRNKKSKAEQKLHGLWVLHRLGALTPKILTAAAHDADRAVRTHAMRVLSETENWTPAYRELALSGLRDADPYVERAAADALGGHPQPGQARPLLDARQRVPPDDTERLHVVRMALRNQLQAPGSFQQLQATPLNEADARALADVSLGVPSAEAGSFVLKHAQKFSTSREGMMNDLRHAARYAPEAELDEVAAVARAKFAEDADTQFTLFKSVQDGLAQRGAALRDSLRGWAAELAEQLFAPGSESKAPWVSAPVPAANNSGNPWILEKRKSADGDSQSVFFSSLPPGGESLTGTLRSRPFTIPPTLSFYLAGHDGPPDQPMKKKNGVRLLAAGSREILVRADPPRNDVAQRVTWDLSAHAGRPGILEITDGNAGRSFAWLAAGRFDPPVVPMLEMIPNPPDQRQQDAADLARTVPLPQFKARLAQLFGAAANAPEVRAAAAHALAVLDPATYVPLLARNLGDTNQTPVMREKIAGILAGLNSPAARDAALTALGTAPQRLQIQLALSLAGTAAGAEALLTLAGNRKLSPRVLAERSVKERLAAAKLPQFDERFEKLTVGLAPASAELQKLINGRRAGFDPEQASARRGAAVFEKTCAVCHQLGGQGAVVGPQLDGIGGRGLERLIEDVLDPNRNVDPAFRYSIVTLKDDTVITGLQRREEGEVLVFVDSTGREVSAPKKEIAERRESQLSLMPSNFGETLTAARLTTLAIVSC